MSASSHASTLRHAISGHCAPSFESVKNAFAANFLERDEIGSAVCIYFRGEKVVDLYGGLRHVEPPEPWLEDTLVCMFSVGKALAALCALVLVDRHELELERPVAHYWPEFAANGKARITVRQLLAHRAGLIYPDAVPLGGLLDWEAMTCALAAQKPEWPDGCRGAYHSSTYGHLVGELVRRVTGIPIDQYFRATIAQPLRVEYYFGVPREHQHRIADVVPNPSNATLTAIATDPTSNIGRAWRPLPQVPDIFNSPLWRESVYPSASGHGNARAVATIYAALASRGALHGVRLLGAATVELARQEQWYEPCGLTGREYRLALGFGLNDPRYNRLGPNPRAFGHAGAGGALGFADPENEIAFSYCTNHPAAGDSIGERCEALVRAVYRCLKAEHE